MLTRALRYRPSSALAIPIVAVTALVGLALTPVAAQASVTLTEISTPFNGPVGIDHYAPTNQVLLTVNYPSGNPFNFELVSADGTHTGYSTISGFTDELKVATVRPGPCQGGFAVGEAFSGTGTPGQIVRIAPGGGTYSFINLPGETGLMRGSLFHDRYCVAGGDLVAVTTTGGVWRVTSAGVPIHITNIPGVHLEGLSTIPNDPVLYGPWAGKILAGAEGQGLFWAIDPVTGARNSFNLGIPPEDIDVIPANENFFGVNYAGGKIMGAPASEFDSMEGDILATQESPGILWHVRWSGTNFVKTSIAQVQQWEHVTFSSAGIVEIPPVDDDADDDGVNDPDDNCVNTPNPGQEDNDGDGVGDVCDDDDDNDGVLDASDNCRTQPNPNQEDNDGDGIGDVCDPDDDNDGVPDTTDNCRTQPNPDQADADHDGIGDVCDGDRDGDGVVNTSDNCPDQPNAGQQDSDGDGIGDACETNLPGQMTGGGRVDSSDISVSHGFTLQCSGSGAGQALEVNWNKHRFHLETVTSALCGDNPAVNPSKPDASFDTLTGSGTGRYDGAPGATASWVFVDGGEPGSNDRVQLTIKDAGGNVVLAISGALAKGNQQAHHEKA